MSWRDSPEHPRGPEQIREAARELGFRMDQLAALHRQHDPFHTGGAADERDTTWFMDVWRRFVGLKTHLRRLHYKVLSSRLPSATGEPYENTERHADMLYRTGSKARDLDLVDPLALDDRRNPEPIVNVEPRLFVEPEPSWSWTPPEPWDVPTDLDDLDELATLPRFDTGGVTVDGGYSYDPGDAPVLVEVWIEKTTMDDVLVPLCRNLSVNLVRFAGFGSEIAVARLLRRIASYDKPARILYVSDFDPAGDAMHVAVARTIEFYRPKLAPDADIALQRIVLTREQVEQYELPRIPIKDDDRRKANFEAANGIGAVELDALEALHPGELRRIVRAAIEPYLDPGLRGRLRDAETEASRVADHAFWDATVEIRQELDRLTDEIAATARDYRQRRQPIQNEYWDRRRPIDEEYNRRLAELQDWRDEQEQPLAEDLRQELAPRLDELTVLRDRLAETVEEMAPDLPERPEGEYAGADDEPDWLYRSDRHWLDQLARYHAERSRKFTSRTRNCVVCGETFTPVRSDALYCKKGVPPDRGTPPQGHTGRCVMGNSYGARLFDHHAKLLADSAISPEVANERGYVTADTKTRLEQLGFAGYQRRVPGLLVPVYDETGTVALHQYRPDSPRTTKAGKMVKYETPSGTKMAVDVPPRIREQLGNPGVPLWVTEGVRKADAAVTAGLCCLALLGVWNWRGTNSNGGATVLAFWESVALKGRQVYVCFDSDIMTKRSVHSALARLGGFLTRRGAQVSYVYMPGGDGDGTVCLDDYLAAGGNIDELAELAQPEPLQPAVEQPELVPASPPAAPSTLADTVTVFRKWLYLDDPAPLYALAATLVANHAPGDPVWLLVVCAPSTGKTELLSAAARLPWVRPASTLTASSLLSGTSKRDRAKDATGGLLCQIGDFGVILAKDFTSVLAQNRDTRAEALAALREVYDGRWDRAVGSDGGRMLTWTGKAGMVGGVTPAIDRYGAVIAALGDRFLMLRMPDVDPEAAYRAALRHGEHEKQMRHELREALAGLVEHADRNHVNRQWSDEQADRLGRLAIYTARTRTAVERDGYSNEVLYLPQIEGPGRLVKAYARLLGGLAAIGCDQDTAWSVLGRVAVDCAPAVRTTLIRELLRRDQPAKTTDIAAAVGMVTKTAARHLEDLSLLKVAERSKTGAGSNSPDWWAASKWLRDHWPESKTEMYLPAPNPHEVGDDDNVDDDDTHPPPRTSLSHSAELPDPLWDAYLEES